MELTPNPPSGLPRQRIDLTIEKYYRLVDANDIDGILALFTANCIYERPGYDPILGSQALRRFYEVDRVIAAGAHVVDRVITAADSAAVEGIFEGVLRSGEEVSVRFADFFHMVEGLIGSRRTYFYAPLV